MTAPANDRGAVLERLPFLAQLEPSLRELVVGLFQTRTFAFGETIVAQGDTADGMYVLASGSARALVVHEGKEITLARLQAGDWFGETALLDRTTRTATVRASEPVSALWLDRVVFDALLELHPEIRGAFGNQARRGDAAPLSSHARGLRRSLAGGRRGHVPQAPACRSAGRDGPGP